MKAGSSVASPGCRRFRSRDDTTAIARPRVALSAEGPTRLAGRAHERAKGTGCCFAGCAGMWGAQRGCSFAAGVVAVTEGEGEPPAIVAGRMCDEASEGWKVRHPCHAEPLPSMPEPRPGDRKRPN